MCNICDKQAMDRRRFMTLAGVTLAAASPLFAWEKAFAAGPTTSVTADQALEKLKAGNDKYVKGPELCAADLAKSRAGVAGNQMPWATIVSCADSRVPPELLFGGLGVGELFVARNAGNGAAAGVTMEASARQFGLDFAPRELHHVELWVDTRWTGLRAMTALRDALTGNAFRRRLTAIGGYDLTRCGAELVGS